jgi:hypothetical protein
VSNRKIKGTRGNSIIVVCSFSGCDSNGSFSQLLLNSRENAESTLVLDASLVDANELFESALIEAEGQEKT